MEGRDEKGRFTEGNKISVGNNGGRPPKFKTPQEFDLMVDNYIESCEGEKDEEGEWIKYPKPLTVTGLALYLGFCDKKELYWIRDNKSEFYHSVKRALMLVECDYEERLASKSVTGAIFALKNFGWEDNRKVDQTTTVSFKVPTGQTDLESDDLD